jgi:hypothetical protein
LHLLIFFDTKIVVRRSIIVSTILFWVKYWLPLFRLFKLIVWRRRVGRLALLARWFVSAYALWRRNSWLPNNRSLFALSWAIISIVGWHLWWSSLIRLNIVLVIILVILTFNLFLAIFVFVFAAILALIRLRLPCVFVSWLLPFWYFFGRIISGYLLSFIYINPIWYRIGWVWIRGYSYTSVIRNRIVIAVTIGRLLCSWLVSSLIATVRNCRNCRLVSRLRLGDIWWLISRLRLLRVRVWCGLWLLRRWLITWIWLVVWR